MAILDTAGNGGWRKQGTSARGGAGMPVLLKVLLSLFGLCAAAGAAVVLGFVAFLWSIDRKEPVDIRMADGVVALTGGVDRISDAVQWLSAGSGKRLLISGVAPDVTAERLAAKAPEIKPWLRCCIDLGHAARNTVGNAKEIRHWALANGYRSLLVVTSSYHMPRAMVEMRRQLPDFVLTPAPVVTPRFQTMDFRNHPELLRIIGVEYLKFVAASVRAALTPARPVGETSDTANRRRV
jgi:uncharacterized SAM-binding protein YcdF (DUF218 family)